MNKEKVDKINQIRNKALKVLKPLDEQLKIYEKINKKVAEELYPKILDAIQKEIFDKGLCYKATYLWLDYASRAIGPHYQLEPLGDIVKFDPTKKYDFNDCAISNNKQLDSNDYVLKIRILNRYFKTYYPNYELLKEELNIDITKLNR